MGYERNHAIIVSAWDFTLELLRSAHRAIQEQTAFRPTAIAHDSCNLGYHTFLVPPDGSKEGWEESHRGDRERDVVVKILRSYEYEDGSNPLHWVEVQYHDDNGDDKVTRSGKGLA